MVVIRLQYGWRLEIVSVVKMVDWCKQSNSENNYLNRDIDMDILEALDPLYRKENGDLTVTNQNIWTRMHAVNELNWLKKKNRGKKCMQKRVYY